MLRRRLEAGYDVLAMDTGQHYDYELNALLYQQLGVRAPDAILEVGSAGHAEQTAAILVRAETVLREFRPRAVVVIGDTNSTLGCALAAAKLRLPVVHVEAGLRADDVLMPEEIDRRVVDAIAHVLCTPSARATRRCQAERQDAAIVETGDVAYDALLAQADRLPAPPVPNGADGPFCFATVHRAELTDRPEVLRGVLEALASLDRPVLLALHPRTRAALREAGIEPRFGKGLTVVPPVGYLESLALARSAEMVFTDSGGLQREAYWLGSRASPCGGRRSGWRRSRKGPTSPSIRRAPRRSSRAPSRSIAGAGPTARAGRAPPTVPVMPRPHRRRSRTAGALRCEP